MRISFTLDNKKAKNDEQKVLLVCTLNGERFRLATGVAVVAKFWLAESERVSHRHSKANFFNTQLASLRSLVDETYHYLALQQRDVSAATLKFHVQERRHGTQAHCFLDYCNRYLEQRSHALNISTLQAYKATFTILQDIEREHRSTLFFQDFNAAFYDVFVRFCLERGLTDNTIGKHIKNLKAVLSWCERQDCVVTKHYRSYKTINKETSGVALNEHELERLAGLDVQHSSRLWNVQQLFLLSCYTGLRFSDAVRLTPDNITNNALSLVIKKTRQSLTIPLLPEARAVLERTANTANLHAISNQHFNLAIKELAKLANITDTVTMRRFAGVQDVTRTGEKWQFVSSHTARRTFVTLCIKRRIPIHLVQRVIGHTTLNNIMRYLKLEYTEVEQEFLNVWIRGTTL